MVEGGEREERRIDLALGGFDLLLRSSRRFMCAGKGHTPVRDRKKWWGQPVVANLGARGILNTQRSGPSLDVGTSGTRSGKKWPSSCTQNVQS